VSDWLKTGDTSTGPGSHVLAERQRMQAEIDRLTARVAELERRLPDEAPIAPIGAHYQVATVGCPLCLGRDDRCQRCGGM
jgi:hypothetical protein